MGSLRFLGLSEGDHIWIHQGTHGAPGLKRRMCKGLQSQLLVMKWLHFQNNECLWHFISQGPAKKQWLPCLLSTQGHQQVWPGRKKPRSCLWLRHAGWGGHTSLLFQLLVCQRVPTWVGREPQTTVLTRGRVWASPQPPSLQDSQLYDKCNMQPRAADKQSQTLGSSHPGETNSFSAVTFSAHNTIQ